MNHLNYPRFGMFHTGLEIDKNGFRYALNNPYIDTFICETDYHNDVFDEELTKIAESGKKTWISFSYLVFELLSTSKMTDVGQDNGFNPEMRLRVNYEDNLNALRVFLKNKSYYDAILGFYIDEPLLWNISLSDFETATGALHKIFPDKRIFSCFSIAGISPETWTINDVRPITEKAGRYLTDVAFDMYHAFDYETYKSLTKEMLSRLNNPDVYVWFIPCTMNYRGDKDEQHCIDHLEGCYRLLTEEKKRGGLICFTWRTFPPELEDLGNVGIDKLSDKTYKDYWPKLMKKIDEIGEKIKKLKGEDQ